MCGQIVDATLVDVSTQHSTAPEMDVIKAGKITDVIWPDGPPARRKRTQRHDGR
jgi:hypothetical protein